VQRELALIRRIVYDPHASDGFGDGVGERGGFGENPHDAATIPLDLSGLIEARLRLVVESNAFGGGYAGGGR